MRIINPMTEDLYRKACVQFEYKGFTVSSNNVFSKFETVVITPADKYISCNNIPEAIHKIDEITKK